LKKNHTADNLSDSISETLKDYNIKDKVIALVGDNASVMPLTASKLKIPFRPCFAHTLNLIVKRVFKNMTFGEGFEEVDDEDFLFEFSTKPNGLGVKDLINKCRDLASLFNRSNILTTALLEAQKNTQHASRPVVLIQDVRTRYFIF
jgi:hypothetical protein